MKSTIFNAVIAIAACVSITESVPIQAQAPRSTGEVSVQGNRLLRDGQPWIPHGFHQIAFVLPPGVAPTEPFFKVAADNYTPKEF